MTTGKFLSHSELPQPIRFKYIDSSNEFTNILQTFIDKYSDSVARFTIDDDNVGRGLVCAFIRDSSEIKGVMVYSKKDKIQEYLEEQGFQCSLEKENPNELSAVIQCIRI